jgi:hypothetical protein
VGGGATTTWDQTLRPWRRASGLIALVQMPAMAAAILLVFFGGKSTHVLAFALAAAVVLCDIVQWALARAAVRRVPDSLPAEVYASLPLDGRERRLVALSLLTGLVGPIFLLAAMPDTSFFKDHLGAAAVLLIASETPTFLSLLRVRRHNTWLAISRIPGRPRESHPRYRGPNTV